MRARDDASTEKRLWARPGARILLALCLVVAGVLAWIVYRGHVQRDAVAMIARGGGNVLYDWQLHKGHFDPEHFLWQISIEDKKGQPRWPGWLVALLGVDALTDVKMAHIGSSDPDAVMAFAGRLRALEELTFDEQSPLTDAGMFHLRGLTELKVLMLPSSKITGHGLVNLEGLTRLLKLSIAGGSLASAHLAALRGMENLEELTLVSSESASVDLDTLRNLKRLKMISLTRILVKDLEPIRQLPELLSLNLVDSELEDFGLAPIGAAGSLPNLVTLALINTRLTDASVTSLRNLPRLATILLEGMPFTDAGVANLCALTPLAPFSLARTRVTDAGLAVLTEKRPNLNAINLSDTQITDLGLKHLSRLRRPIELNLKGTRVTDAGVAAFLRTHPFVRIIR
jgi:hypothetical protein